MRPNLAHARRRHPNRQRDALQPAPVTRLAMKQRSARFAAALREEAAARGLPVTAALR